jgi:hypothetical protein
VYDALIDHDQSVPNPASRKKWLALQQQGTFLPQPYEQLAKVLRDSGDEEGAKEILIAKNQGRAQHMRPGLRRVWHWFLGVTTAYGYRPERAIWWAVGWIAVGWILFSLGFHTGGMTCTKGAHEYRPERCSLVYSIETFIPLVTLHQAEYWLPHAGRGCRILPWKYSPAWGTFLSVYLSIHIFAGWIVSTLLVVGLTGLIRV